MRKAPKDLRRIAEEVQKDRAWKTINEAAEDGKLGAIVSNVPDYFIQELKECGFVTSCHDGICGWNVNW